MIAETAAWRRGEIGDRAYIAALEQALGRTRREWEREQREALAHLEALNEQLNAERYERLAREAD